MGWDRRRDDSEVRVDGTAVSIGRHRADAGDVPTSFAIVLRAVRGRRSRGANRLRLGNVRDDDLAVLAAALGEGGGTLEARIQALLDCSRTEARVIHRELRRRRLLTPVATMAVGAAVVWGPAAAARGDRPRLEDTATTTTAAAAPADQLPGE
jgi:hypothetical protein